MNYAIYRINRKNYLKYITSFFESILYALFITIIAMILFGYKVIILIGNSMSPTMWIDDVVVIKKVEEKDLKVGDVVTFGATGGVYTTHRIYEIVDGGFITKGDANTTPDGAVLKYPTIQGKVFFFIPKIGKVLNLFRNLYSLISIIIGVLAVVFCVRYFKFNYEKKYIPNIS